jgi:NADH-quinone oxidoreductase subunit E
LIADLRARIVLTKEEQDAIEAELAHYPDKRAACIEAMKIVQRHRGWLSDESLRDLGPLLDMSAAELDGVATFYTLLFRRPVGRHVILLCDSVTCWMVGEESLLKHLRDRLGIGLGETTADNRFTLLPIACLGTCDRAPALMIDEDLHRDLAPDQLDDILNRYA